MAVCRGSRGAEITPAAEQVPLVTVEIERNGKQVSGPFTLKVTIANTLSGPIFLKQLKTIVPAALSRGAKRDQQPESWQKTDFSKAQLPAGQKRVVRIEVPKSPPWEPAMLFFIASKLETGVTLSYDIESLNDLTRELESTINVEWEGSLWGKILGGIIGCVILAVFLGVRQVFDPHAAESEKSGHWEAWKTFFNIFWFAFLLGGATVFAAILLVAFLAPGSLPITFSVDDWRGGVLVGLFSVSIGRWLMTKIGFESSSEKETAKQDK